MAISKQQTNRIKLDYKGYPINKEGNMFNYIGNEYKTLEECQAHIDNKEITFHRKPTDWEIKFGEGAIHYKDFRIKDLKVINGKVQTRVKCPIDGLIYTRN